jgi:hypothetical protein
MGTLVRFRIELKRCKGFPRAPPRSAALRSWPRAAAPAIPDRPAAGVRPAAFATPATQRPAARLLPQSTHSRPRQPRSPAARRSRHLPAMQARLLRPTAARRRRPGTPSTQCTQASTRAARRTRNGSQSTRRIHRPPAPASTSRWLTRRISRCPRPTRARRLFHPQVQRRCRRCVRSRHPHLWPFSLQRAPETSWEILARIAARSVARNLSIAACR